MAKILDITDKLTYDGNPVLVIKGKEIEVNADAVSMLRIINLMQDDSESNLTDAYELLFSEKSRKQLEELGLSFKDMNTVIECAMNLASGNEDEGEGSGE